MINALVSHEMRNPLNSIATMIIKNMDLSGAILKLIQDQTLSVQKLRFGIKHVLDQIVDNLKIQ